MSEVAPPPTPTPAPAPASAPDRRARHDKLSVAFHVLLTQARELIDVLAAVSDRRQEALRVHFDMEAEAAQLRALIDAGWPASGAALDAKGRHADAQATGRELAAGALAWATTARAQLRLAALVEGPDAAVAAVGLRRVLAPFKAPRMQGALRVMRAFVALGQTHGPTLGATGRTPDVLGEAEAWLTRLEAGQAAIDAGRLETAATARARAALANALRRQLRLTIRRWDLAKGRVSPPLPNLPLPQLGGA